MACNSRIATQNIWLRRTVVSVGTFQRMVRKKSSHSLSTHQQTNDTCSGMDFGIHLQRALEIEAS